MKEIANLKSFLLDNKTINQTILKNTFWISLSAAIGKLLRAFLIIYIAKILGPTDYGWFAFALAFVSVFVTFFDLGLSPIITREFSRDKEQEKEFSSLFSLKMILGLGTIFIIWIGSFFITQDLAVRRVIWILASFSFVSQFPEIIYAYLRARQKMEYEAWANIVQVLLIVGLGFFVIFNFPSIENISWSYLIAGLVSLLVVLLFFHFKFFPLKFSFKTNIWKKFLLMSWPLALTSVFGLLYSYIDSIMMGSLGQIAQTGWYNASLKVINIALVPAGIVSMVFYPVLSKFSQGAKDQFQKVWDSQMAIIIFLVLPIVVGGFVLAPKIIDFVYGDAYLPAVLAFQILIFMAGIGFLNVPLGQILIVADQQKKVFWVSFMGAIVNIVLNMVLIPKFSLYGAALATVFTYLAMFLLYFGFTFRFTSIKLLNKYFFLTFLKVVLSAFLMYIIISCPSIYNLHIILSVLVGIFVYSISYFIFNILFKNVRAKRV